MMYTGTILLWADRVWVIEYTIKGLIIVRNIHNDLMLDFSSGQL